MVLEEIETPAATDEMTEDLFAGMTDEEKNDYELEEKMKLDVVQKIESTLETYDFPPNWILDQEYFDSNAEMVFEIITNKMIELADEPDEAELKYSAMEIIGKKITQIFLGIYLDKFGTVDMEDFKGFIHSCCKEKYYVFSGYLPGVTYCLEGLEAYLVTKLPSTVYSLSRIQLVYDQLGSIEDLKGPGYVGLLALKQCFIGQMHRTCYKAQNEIIRAVVKVYPESGEWNLWLHNILRFQRRDSSQNKPKIPPGREEIDLIVKAAELEPQNPLVLTRLCDTLAEIVKYRGPHWSGLEDLGFGRVFHSSRDIADYVRKVARHILELDSQSLKTNISIGTIFSAVLPSIMRDLPFAKCCIERALFYHPNSSKASGRMAIFCLTVDEDVKEAEKFFENSLKMDPRNFQTLIDLLLTHMAHYEENSHKIDKHLEREFVNTKLSDFNRGSLYFVKGIYEFLRGNTEESLDNWLSAVENFNYPLVKFKKFGYFQARYGWPEERITLNLIYSKLSVLPERLPLSKRLTLDTILRCIGDEMAEDRERQTKHAGPGTRIFRGKPIVHYSRTFSRSVDFRGGFSVGPIGGRKRSRGSSGDHKRGCNGDGGQQVA